MRVRRPIDPSRCSFKKLCTLVIDFAYPYEDLAELIEDKGYEECISGNGVSVIRELSGVCAFFETMERKNEENVRDLADVYLLTGEFCQVCEQVRESVAWFRKAIIVDDTYDVPYHSLAASYMSLGEVDNAIRSLEREIEVAPGNYYSYLMLADLYDRQGRYDSEEEVLRNLLSRDSDNIQALHTLIGHYRKRNPTLDTELLCRRLINASREMVKRDLIIWTYHMCQENRHEEALKFLEERQKESPGNSIIHLLCAYLYGCRHLYVKKRRELREFKKLNHGRTQFIRTTLDEFEAIFGEPARSRLEKKLTVTKLTSR